MTILGANVAVPLFLVHLTLKSACRLFVWSLTCIILLVRAVGSLQIFFCTFALAFSFNIHQRDNKIRNAELMCLSEIHPRS